MLVLPTWPWQAVPDCSLFLLYTQTIFQLWLGTPYTDLPIHTPPFFVCCPDPEDSGQPESLSRGKKGEICSWHPTKQVEEYLEGEREWEVDLHLWSHWNAGHLLQWTMAETNSTLWKNSRHLLYFIWFSAHYSPSLLLVTIFSLSSSQVNPSANQDAPPSLGLEVGQHPTSVIRSLCPGALDPEQSKWGRERS